MEAQRDKRDREVWEREMRDMREMEFIEKMKQEMELKLPGAYCQRPFVCCCIHRYNK